jgi:ankyrin repeat protein
MKITTICSFYVSLAVFCFIRPDDRARGISNISRKSHESLMSKQEKRLFSAVAKGDNQRLEFLLRKRVNPNAKDDKGNAPIHYAKDLNSIELLTKYGADINAQNNDGLTKLHMDVVLGKAAAVQHLLARNANVRIADNTGVTPH